MQAQIAKYSHMSDLPSNGRQSFFNYHIVADSEVFKNSVVSFTHLLLGSLKFEMFSRLA